MIIGDTFVSRVAEHVRRDGRCEEFTVAQCCQNLDRVHSAQVPQNVKLKTTNDPVVPTIEAPGRPHRIQDMTAWLLQARVMFGRCASLAT